MGQSTKNGADGRIPGVARNDLRRARFGAFFPRVFACAHSLTGDETSARETVIEAFSRAFAHPADLNDEEFVILLFATVRDLCRSAWPAQSDGDLSGRERELLALLFDARLTREEVSRLMRTTEQALSSALLGALRKIRASVYAPAGKASFRPA